MHTNKTVSDLLGHSEIEGITWGVFDLREKAGWVVGCPSFDEYASEAHGLLDTNCPCKPKVEFAPDDIYPLLVHNLTAHDEYLARERLVE